MPELALPPFRPHPLLFNGHLQTIFAHCFDAAPPLPATETWTCSLDGDDRLVLHDDAPADWPDGGPVCLLVHGLGGSHASAYLRRIARKLSQRGVRVVRMDLRGCGAGAGLARRPYHGGLSGDVDCALRAAAERAPGSLLLLVGFSLGGNLCLKLLAEYGASPPAYLRAALAVCPPVDLALSVQRLGRVYSRYFARLLWRRVRESRALGPYAPNVALSRAPRNLLAFDEQFTAPAWGFADAADYYARSSSGPRLESITVPTTILAAADDPLVPIAALRAAALSPSTVLELTSCGGHMGFICPRGLVADGRWMDAYVVEWAVRQVRNKSYS